MKKTQIVGYGGVTGACESGKCKCPQGSVGSRCEKALGKAGDPCESASDCAKSVCELDSTCTSTGSPCCKDEHCGTPTCEEGVCVTNETLSVFLDDECNSDSDYNENVVSRILAIIDGLTSVEGLKMLGTFEFIGGLEDLIRKHVKGRDVQAKNV